MNTLFPDDLHVLSKSIQILLSAIIGSPILVRVSWGEVSVGNLNLSNV